MSDLIYLFISGLNEKLQENYDTSNIARYAYEFYLDHDIDDERLRYVVDYLKGMDADPVFELSKDEVTSFVRENLFYI
ncbi:MULTISPECIES: hypothetical protein [Photorhabdus]|uniref:Uncharacterized protein n=1 Tax=Photorhabdus luminescens subsp. sonorensis TaxID=1173677 RepID=A0A5C4RFC4_PHOLU|nr:MULTISPECIES: hypothetical protein [Photorhabdus]MCW7549461.1 hypothetical protein [Photorhabdus aballayi]TNH42646.1 hypothetical protein EP164_15420 [Photorhabdus luminescens subsp. sonorensis]